MSSLIYVAVMFFMVPPTNASMSMQVVDFRPSVKIDEIVCVSLMHRTNFLCPLAKNKKKNPFLSLCTLTLEKVDEVSFIRTKCV